MQVQSCAGSVLHVVHVVVYFLYIFQILPVCIRARILVFRYTCLLRNYEVVEVVRCKGLNATGVYGIECNEKTNT